MLNPLGERQTQYTKVIISHDYSLTANGKGLQLWKRDLMGTILAK